MANERNKVTLADWKGGRGRTELPPAARKVFSATIVALVVISLLVFLLGLLWIGLLMFLGFDDFHPS